MVSTIKNINRKQQQFDYKFPINQRTWNTFIGSNNSNRQLSNDHLITMKQSATTVSLQNYLHPNQNNQLVHHSQHNGHSSSGSTESSGTVVSLHHRIAEEDDYLHGTGRGRRPSALLQDILSTRRPSAIMTAMRSPGAVGLHQKPRILG